MGQFSAHVHGEKIKVEVQSFPCSGERYESSFVTLKLIATDGTTLLFLDDCNQIETLGLDIADAAIKARVSAEVEPLVLADARLPLTADGVV